MTIRKVLGATSSLVTRAELVSGAPVVISKAIVSRSQIQAQLQPSSGIIKVAQNPTTLIGRVFYDTDGGLSRFLRDYLIGSDSILLSLIIGRSFNEVLSAVDLFSITQFYLSRVVVDTASFSESSTLRVSKSAQDYLTLGETSAKTASKTLADQIQILDVLDFVYRIIGIAPRDTLTLGDYQNLRVAQLKLETLGVFEAVNKLSGKPVADSVSILSSLDIEALIGLVRRETVQVQEARALTVSLPKIEDLTAEDTPYKLIGKPQSEIIDAREVLVPLIGKGLSEQINSVETRAFYITAPKIEDLTADDVPYKLVGKPQLDEVNTEAVYVPLIGKGLSERITATESKIFDLSLTKTDSLYGVQENIYKLFDLSLVNRDPATVSILDTSSLLPIKLVQDLFAQSDFRVLDISKSFADIASMLDLAGVYDGNVFDWITNRFDTLITNDVIARVSRTSRSIDDIVNSNDDFARVFSVQRLLQDTQTQSDVRSLFITSLKSDSVSSAQDRIYKLVGARRTDQQEIVDAGATKFFGLNILTDPEMLEKAEFVILKAGINDTAASTEYFMRRFNATRGFAESAYFGDGPFLSQLKRVADTSTSTDNFAKVWQAGRRVNDAVGREDRIYKFVQKMPAHSLVIGERIRSFGFTKLLQDIAAMVDLAGIFDGNIYNFSKSISEPTLNVSEFLARAVKFRRRSRDGFIDNVTITDFLSIVIPIGLQDVFQVRDLPPIFVGGRVVREQQPANDVFYRQVAFYRYPHHNDIGIAGEGFNSITPALDDSPFGTAPAKSFVTAIPSPTKGDTTSTAVVVGGIGAFRNQPGRETAQLLLNIDAKAGATYTTTSKTTDFVIPNASFKIRSSPAHNSSVGTIIRPRDRDQVGTVDFQTYILLGGRRVGDSVLLGRSDGLGFKVSGFETSVLPFNYFTVQTTGTTSTAAVVPTTSILTDIATGNLVGSYDDGYVPYALPWNVSWYGRSSNTIYIGTNSYITFDSGQASFTGIFAAAAGNLTGILSVNAGSLGLSSDYILDSLGAAITGTAPNRIATVVYKGHQYGYTPTTDDDYNTWQVQFFEARPWQHSIRMQATRGYSFFDTSIGAYSSSAAVNIWTNGYDLQATQVRQVTDPAIMQIGTSSSFTFATSSYAVQGAATLIGEVTPFFFIGRKFDAVQLGTALRPSSSNVNLVAFSTDIGAAAWDIGASYITVTRNVADSYGINPFGVTSQVTQLTSTAAQEIDGKGNPTGNWPSAYFGQKLLSGVGRNQPHNFSVWVRTTTGNTASFGIAASTAGAAGTFNTQLAITATPVWTRYDLDFTPTVATPNIMFGTPSGDANRFTDGSAPVYVWGAQVTPGSGVRATYTPTTSGAIIVPADRFSGDPLENVSYFMGKRAKVGVASTTSGISTSASGVLDPVIVGSRYPGVRRVSGDVFENVKIVDTKSLTDVVVEPYNNIMPEFASVVYNSIGYPAGTQGWAIDDQYALPRLVDDENLGIWNYTTSGVVRGTISVLTPDETAISYQENNASYGQPVGQVAVQAFNSPFWVGGLPFGSVTMDLSRTRLLFGSGSSINLGTTSESAVYDWPSVDNFNYLWVSSTITLLNAVGNPVDYPVTLVDENGALVTTPRGDNAPYLSIVEGLPAAGWTGWRVVQAQWWAPEFYNYYNNRLQYSTEFDGFGTSYLRAVTVEIALYRHTATGQQIISYAQPYYGPQNVNASLLMLSDNRAYYGDSIYIAPTVSSTAVMLSGRRGFFTARSLGYAGLSLTNEELYSGARPANRVGTATSYATSVVSQNTNYPPSYVTSVGVRFGSMEPNSSDATVVEALYHGSYSPYYVVTVDRYGDGVDQVAMVYHTSPSLAAFAAPDYSTTGWDSTTQQFVRPGTYVASVYVDPSKVTSGATPSDSPVDAQALGVTVYTVGNNPNLTSTTTGYNNFLDASSIATVYFQAGYATNSSTGLTYPTLTAASSVGSVSNITVTPERIWLDANGNMVGDPALSSQTYVAGTYVDTAIWYRVSFVYNVNTSISVLRGLSGDDSYLAHRDAGPNTAGVRRFRMRFSQHAVWGGVVAPVSNSLTMPTRNFRLQAPQLEYAPRTQTRPSRYINTLYRTTGTNSVSQITATQATQTYERVKQTGKVIADTLDYATSATLNAAALSGSTLWASASGVVYETEVSNNCIVNTLFSLVNISGTRFIQTTSSTASSWTLNFSYLVGASGNGYGSLENGENYVLQYRSTSTSSWTTATTLWFGGSSWTQGSTYRQTSYTLTLGTTTSLSWRFALFNVDAGNTADGAALSGVTIRTNSVSSINSVSMTSPVGLSDRVAVAGTETNPLLLYSSGLVTRTGVTERIQSLLGKLTRDTLILGRGTVSETYPERRSGDNLDNPAFFINKSAKTGTTSVFTGVATSVTSVATSTERIFIGDPSLSGLRRISGQYLENTTFYVSKSAKQGRVSSIAIQTILGNNGAASSVLLSQTTSDTDVVGTLSAYADVRTFVRYPWYNNFDGVPGAFADGSTITDPAQLLVGKRATRGTDPVSATDVTGVFSPYLPKLIIKDAKRGAAGTYLINTIDPNPDVEYGYGSSATVTAGPYDFDAVGTLDQFYLTYMLYRLFQENTQILDNDAFFITKLLRDSAVMLDLTDVFDGLVFNSVLNRNETVTFGSGQTSITFPAARRTGANERVVLDTSQTKFEVLTQPDNDALFITKPMDTVDNANRTVTVLDADRLLVGKRATVGTDPVLATDVTGSFSPYVPRFIGKTAKRGASGTVALKTIDGTVNDGLYSSFAVTYGSYDIDLVGSIDLLTLQFSGPRRFFETLLIGSGFDQRQDNLENVRFFVGQRAGLDQGSFDSFDPAVMLDRITAFNATKGLLIDATPALDDSRFSPYPAKFLSLSAKQGRSVTFSSITVTLRDPDTLYAGATTSLVSRIDRLERTLFFVSKSADAVVPAQVVIGGDTGFRYQSTESQLENTKFLVLKRATVGADPATVIDRGQFSIYPSRFFSKTAQLGAATTIAIKTQDVAGNNDNGYSSVAISTATTDLDFFGTIDLLTLQFSAPRVVNDIVTIGSGLDQRQTTLENISFFITKLIGDRSEILDLTEVFDGLNYRSTLLKREVQIMGSGQTSLTFPARSKTGNNERVAFNVALTAKQGRGTWLGDGNLITFSTIASSNWNYNAAESSTTATAGIADPLGFGQTVYQFNETVQYTPEQDGKGNPTGNYLTVANPHWVETTTNAFPASGSSYTVSFYVRDGNVGNPRWVVLTDPHLIAANEAVNYNPRLGTITRTASSSRVVSAGMYPVGALGWYRCWAQVRMTAAGQGTMLRLYLATDGTVTSVTQLSYVGVTSSGVFIWGPQVTPGQRLQNYVATTGTPILVNSNTGAATDVQRVGASTAARNDIDETMSYLVGKLADNLVPAQVVTGSGFDRRQAQLENISFLVGQRDAEVTTARDSSTFSPYPARLFTKSAQLGTATTIRIKTRDAAGNNDGISTSVAITTATTDLDFFGVIDLITLISVPIRYVNDTVTIGSGLDRRQTTLENIRFFIGKLIGDTTPILDLTEVFDGLKYSSTILKREIVPALDGSQFSPYPARYVTKLLDPSGLAAASAAVTGATNNGYGGSTGSGGDQGGGGGGGVGTNAVKNSSGNSWGDNGANAADFQGLSQVLVQAGTFLGLGGAGADAFAVPSDGKQGGNGSGIGGGGGGAGYYGGDGGAGSPGGGGGGAAGYTVTHVGGAGGSGVTVLHFVTASGSSAVVVATPGRTNYSVPANTLSIRTWVIGAGGSGAGATTDDSSAGGGGGAGSIAYASWPSNVGYYTGTIVISNGAASLGGSGAANGTAGQSSTLTYAGASLTANGGFGGTYNNNTFAYGGDATVSTTSVSIMGAVTGANFVTMGTTSAGIRQSGDALENVRFTAAKLADAEIPARVLVGGDTGFRYQSTESTLENTKFLVLKRATVGADPASMLDYLPARFFAKSAQLGTATTISIKTRDATGNNNAISTSVAITTATTDLDFFGVIDFITLIAVPRRDISDNLTIGSGFDQRQNTRENIRFFIRKLIGDTTPILDLTEIFDGLNYRSTILKRDTAPALDTSTFSPFPAKFFQTAIPSPTKGDTTATAVTVGTTSTGVRKSGDVLENFSYFASPVKADAVAQSDNDSLLILKRAVQDTGSFDRLDPATVLDIGTFSPYPARFFGKSAKIGTTSGAVTIRIKTADAPGNNDGVNSSVVALFGAAAPDFVGALDFISILSAPQRSVNDVITIGSGFDQRQNTLENVRFFITKLIGDRSEILDLTEVFDGLKYSSTILKREQITAGSGQTSQTFPARARSGDAELVTLFLSQTAKQGIRTLQVQGNLLPYSEDWLSNGAGQSNINISGASYTPPFSSLALSLFLGESNDVDGKGNGFSAAHSFAITATNFMVANNAYTISFYLKSLSGDRYLLMSDTPLAAASECPSFYAHPSNGTYSFTTGTTTSIVKAVGMYPVGRASLGWYRCWMHVTPTGTPSTNFMNFGFSNTPSNLGGTPAYQGDGGNHFALWGIQITRGHGLQPYVATTATAIINRVVGDADTDFVTVGSNLGKRAAYDLWENTSFLVGKTDNDDSVTLGSGLDQRQTTAENTKFFVFKRATLDQDSFSRFDPAVMLDSSAFSPFPAKFFNKTAKQGSGTTTVVSGVTVTANAPDRLFVGQQWGIRRQSGDRQERISFDVFKTTGLGGAGSSTSVTITSDVFSPVTTFRLNNGSGQMFESLVIPDPAILSTGSVKYDVQQSVDALVKDSAKALPENFGDLDPYGNINTVASIGKIRMTNYVDIDYIEDDYVGDQRSFT